MTYHIPPFAFWGFLDCQPLFCRLFAAYLPLLWFIQNADKKLPIIGGPGHEQPEDLFILACQQEDCVSHQTDMVYYRGWF